MDASPQAQKQQRPAARLQGVVAEHGAHRVRVAGGAHAFNIRQAFRKLGRTRRIAATMPNFLLALALVAETDLIAAVPRQAARYARQLGVVLADPPAPLAPLTRSPIHVIATRAALEDPGVAWLFRVLSGCMQKPKRTRHERGSATH